MKLIFEKGAPGRSLSLLPECDVPEYRLPPADLREKAPRLPEVSEQDMDRHYTELMKRTYGVNDGFYPLGSCTMKYNPKVNERLASLDGFAQIHPLQPEYTVQGCLEALKMLEEALCEITGMDAMTMQPAAGAHGEFTGLMLMKCYHESRKDTARDKILVPDSAHGTNPASAAMAGFQVVSIPSTDEGCVDLKELERRAGPDTAGLMLTNPNTLGLFDKEILEITDIVHRAGGLTYYDGANLNAVMGIVRPGDMGFDMVHLNLHKTFATPHGGGGPGSGPVGCKQFLAGFLPSPVVAGKMADKMADRVAGKERGEREAGEGFGPYCFKAAEKTMGRVKGFYGNFAVNVKALAYIMSLGREGIPQAARSAVLNANYMMECLRESYPMAGKGHCMHEFVMSLEDLKKESGVTALDIAKGLLDEGIHPPTMYFPLIVHEALMAEPTDTESKEVIDRAVEAFRHLYETALKDPDRLKAAPATTPVGRPDEVLAARKPKLRYGFGE